MSPMLTVRGAGEVMIFLLATKKPPWGGLETGGGLESGN
jgi:hypothetical protein